MYPESPLSSLRPPWNKALLVSGCLREPARSLKENTHHHHHRPTKGLPEAPTGLPEGC